MPLIIIIIIIIIINTIYYNKPKRGRDHSSSPKVPNPIESTINNTRKCYNTPSHI